MLNCQSCSVLIGAPNSGKTTLFNWLTSSQFQTVNYPGATVSYRSGKLQSFTENGKRKLTNTDIIDTPGIYSLLPISDDEKVTCSLLQGKKLTNSISSLIFVLDGRKIKQQLSLLFHVKNLKNKDIPLIIAVTMQDQIEDIESLSQSLEKLNFPYYFIDGRFGKGVPDLEQAIHKFSRIIESLNFCLIPETEPQLKISQKLSFEQSRNFFDETMQDNPNVSQLWSLDSLFLHPIFGLSLFIIMSFLIFSSIFFFATPFMDSIDSFFGLLSKTLESYSQNLFVIFLSQGLVQGLGAVMVFVPQIFILFFLLGLLEDSGYLARASVLMDRFFSYFGLSGKAFVPLLSSFACAVPAIMATRSISDKKQKLLTMVAIPFMTCSAKLPVYALLISVLLGSEPTWKKSLLLTTIYFLSFLIGAVASKIVFYFLRKNKIDTNFLVLELPAYHKPNIMFNIKSALRRTKSYLTKAGPVILIISVLIWMTTALPLKDKQVANINDSYLGQFGQKIESVFQPMGANWKVGLSLLTSFAAREVFVSTLAIIYAPSMKDSDETKIIKTLSEMKDGNGTPIITWPLALSILTFFMFALQCLTTTVMMYKESMSLTFALSQLLTMNLVAYFLAVIVYQSFS